MQLLYRFWLFAHQLKSLERKGWKIAGINPVESVADHSFAVALLAMLESKRRDLDVTAAMGMALIHDLEEAITGDLTPADKRIRGRQRVEAERRAAVDQLLAVLPGGSRASYRRLWTDLRLSQTREARLVHELDKLEMAFQAKTYEKTVGGRRIRAFYESAAREIQDPALKRMMNSLKREQTRRLGRRAALRT